MVCAKNTWYILPTEVYVHTTMHEALAWAHEKPKTQLYLHQASQHLNMLDTLTAMFYLTHNTTTTQSPTNELISLTPMARCIINQACASWKSSIEQLMTTTKLVTVHKLLSRIPKSTKRTVRRARRTQHATDHVTYCETFDAIKSTLKKNDTLNITLK